MSLSTGNLPKELSGLVEEMRLNALHEQEGFSLGDLLQVKGRIKVFRQVREISGNIIGECDKIQNIMSPQAQIHTCLSIL